MSFYKNITRELRGGTYYPVGSIVKYEDKYAIVEEIDKCSLWHSEGSPCRRFCCFHNICNIKVSPVYCSPSNRVDKTEVYFKKIEI